MGFFSTAAHPLPRCSAGRSRAHQCTHRPFLELCYRSNGHGHRPDMARMGPAPWLRVRVCPRPEFGSGCRARGKATRAHGRVVGRARRCPGGLPLGGLPGPREAGRLHSLGHPRLSFVADGGGFTRRGERRPSCTLDGFGTLRPFLPSAPAPGTAWSRGVGEPGSSQALERSHGLRPRGSSPGADADVLRAQEPGLSAR